MVIEAGVVAGYVIAWAVRKARRAARRLDAEADAVIDAGLDKLHEVVASKLGKHPALDDLSEEAADGSGQVSELTRQQLELAVTAAARKDDEFGQAVTDLVTRLRAAEAATEVSVVASGQARVLTGTVDVHADNGSIAVGQVAGDMNVDRAGRGGPGPSEPGRSSH